MLPVCAAATIAPLYFAKHLPFSDLPEHIAAIATLRHYWDPAWDLQKYFVLQDLTRTQYLLYDVVAALLAVVVGSAERANLLILSVVGLGFPYGLRELLRATRRDERLAVFACPLFWNRALAEGLLNYVASIPVGLWGLALVARQSEAPTKPRAWLLAAVSLSLFYLHISTFLLFGAGAVLFMVLVPLDVEAGTALARTLCRVRRLPKQLAWLLPTILAGGLLAWRSPFFHPDPAREGIHSGVLRFSSTTFLLRSLPQWTHDFWRSNADDLAAAVLWTLFAVLLFRRRDPPSSMTSPERAAPLLALLGLAIYFVTPNQVSFAFVLDLRLAPLVALLAPLVLRPRRDRITDAVIAGFAALALFIGAFSAWETYGFERDEASSFDRVLSNLPRGKKLLALIFDRESERANITPFLHFGSYYSARYGGVSSFSFVEVPHWPIQYRPGQEPPKKSVVFWDWNPCLFRNSIDGPYYDFVLTRGEIDPFAGVSAGPTWRTIGSAREWTLYEKSGAGAVGAGPVRRDDGPCKDGVSN